MNFKLELPQEAVLINRTDLKVAILELIEEIKRENPKEEIMTIRDTAEYLKVSVPTVRKMIAKKEIPYFQKGQVIRLNRGEVNGWLHSKSINI